MCTWSIQVIIKDVGSGINEIRKILTRLFKLTRAQEMGSMLIEFPDRLARYGRHYITEYLALHGIEVVITDESAISLKHDRDLNNDLVEELIAKFDSFAGIIYGWWSA